MGADDLVRKLRLTDDNRLEVWDPTNNQWGPFSWPDAEVTVEGEDTDTAGEPLGTDSLYARRKDWRIFKLDVEIQPPAHLR